MAIATTKISWSQVSTEQSNEGNFVELVRFRAETDQVLATHLANSPRNGRYTSKTIQNELVEVTGNSIRSDIVEEVKRAKFYSVIADEVTDSSNKEELSLALRYILDDSIKEVFVDFIEVERITGSVLAPPLAWALSFGYAWTVLRRCVQHVRC